ncbi:hypothetical protein QBC44DRAFT_365386 [Cladorrhinum sp. PSN332]|nr:hypothetical protein QBC44DRAFT_365386 [Cladorrhinum sp. PSN332]
MVPPKSTHSDASDSTKKPVLIEENSRPDKNNTAGSSNESTPRAEGSTTNPDLGTNLPSDDDEVMEDHAADDGDDDQDDSLAEDEEGDDEEEEDEKYGEDGYDKESVGAPDGDDEHEEVEVEDDLLCGFNGGYTKDELDENVEKILAILQIMRVREERHKAAETRAAKEDVEKETPAVREKAEQEESGSEVPWGVLDQHDEETVRLFAGIWFGIQTSDTRLKAINLLLKEREESRGRLEKTVRADMESSGYGRD